MLTILRLDSGNSTAQQEINKTPSKTLAQKWAALSEGAHIGVYCGAAAAGVIVFGAFGWWCQRQRKKGRLQRALDNGQSGEELKKLEAYKLQWRQSEWGQKSYQQVPNT
jgi:hypothetical protein